ncbi:pyridoxamine 5'-phosphate oxidase family protein [Prosthecobacter sp.]|jgi:general stress protein 26|uniref:pyridoxamine 5'-phosphate oxidase family protein n=1 Tax=Prosthecobacter sp. TaxID=1965333 RepID=UPI003783957F
MKIENEVAREAVQVVKKAKFAVLATADERGCPHATWMTTQVTDDLEEIISITAPISQKIADLRRNPQAEWMYATSSMETLVYLSGFTRVIEGEAAKRYWDRMPGKAQAYYRKYCETEDYHKFAVIRTEVSKVVLCKPYAYKKTILFEKTSTPKVNLQD